MTYKVNGIEELKQTIEKFNDTAVEFPENMVINQFFEEQALKKPDNIALVFAEESMTYRELNERANQVAHYLRNQDVCPDDIVGIMVERSFEMIIGIMGILKAGAAYLPIDPKYPVARIQYCTENSNAKLVLTTTQFIDKVTKDMSIVCLDESELFRDWDKSNPEIVARANNLAYIIYTSGSTGKPKGVMIEHKSLVNRLLWMQRTYELTENDALLQKTTFSFDVSVWELLWWSMVGAKLVILPPNKEKDPRAITKIILKEKVTILHFVPSILEIFLDYVSYKFDLKKIESLRKVIVSGEALSVPTVNLFNEVLHNGLGTELWNLYGPTEATIDVTSFNCTNLKKTAKQVPIGKPIDNIKLYILDEDGKMTDIDEPGELCIAGVGVARGYINNKVLTEERFVENAFCKGEKIYKTGDIACWNSDGEIEYHGRMDSQIKLRGLRIELGEIENQLLTHEQVKKAAILVHENDMANKYLIAFYQTSSNTDLTDLDIFLLKTLPDYMIPSKFLRLDTFPTNQNGKLDRKELVKILQDMEQKM